MRFLGVRSGAYRFGVTWRKNWHFGTRHFEYWTRVQVGPLYCLLYRV